MKRRNLLAAILAALGVGAAIGGSARATGGVVVAESASPPPAPPVTSGYMHVMDSANRATITTTSSTAGNVTWIVS